MQLTIRSAREVNSQRFGIDCTECSHHPLMRCS